MLVTWLKLPRGVLKGKVFFNRDPYCGMDLAGNFLLGSKVSLSKNFLLARVPHTNPPTI